jgi:uncharacterized protein (TIGR03435 family)
MKRIAIGLLLAAAAALAQPEAATSVPAFEAASIKPSGPQSRRGSEGGPGTSDPGRYTYNAASLDDLITTAYHVDYFQISSKVPLDKQTFDLAVKIPAGVTRLQFRVMLQNLLAERFHLKAHVEKKDFNGCALLVAKAGTKLKEGAPLLAAASEEGFPSLPPNKAGMIANHTMSGNYELVRMRVQREPMSQLADWLGTIDGPVVDRTGLTGKYDFTFTYTREWKSAAPGTASDPPVAPDVFTALQQQLGLQMVRQKVPLDLVVVESVDKLPVEN